MFLCTVYNISWNCETLPYLLRTVWSAFT